MANLYRTTNAGSKYFGIFYTNHGKLVGPHRGCLYDTKKDALEHIQMEREFLKKPMVVKAIARKWANV